jgi:hypothetical protein
MRTLFQDAHEKLRTFDVRGWMFGNPSVAFVV